MLDYVELEELLARVEAGASAPGCHGFLCGQVCVAGVPAEGLWLEFIDMRSRDEAAITESVARISTLAREITGQLSSPDMDFRILIPDDESPLRERLRALVDWCHGFLNGFGLGRKDGNGALNDACRELLEDYSRICRVQTDVTDNDADADADETAFMELVEYVRVGTMTIYETSFPGVYPEQSPGALH